MGRVYHVEDESEYRKAGKNDLIRLLPISGMYPLFLPKSLLERLVYSIVDHQFVHLSGPTGTAKSSLLEALHLVPQNFRSIVSGMGLEPLSLKMYPIPMAIYETPGELYERRSIRDGSTFDEKSRLVVALEDAAASSGSSYPVIWLREMGRVNSASVQGGLLDLIVNGDVTLPDGTRIDCRNIGWVADSNYQAEQDSIHTLVPLDDALKRRFPVNLTVPYLSPEQEADVLGHIFHTEGVGRSVTGEAIVKAVRLGQAIRRQRLEGNLHSVPPPTIQGYIAFLRMSLNLPQLSVQEAALSTLLGNASSDDRKSAASVLHEVLGLCAEEGEEGDALASNLF